MKTIVFDMYGVIMKDPKGGLVPFINRTFPNLKDEDVYKYWIKAGTGEMTALDFWRNLGFKNPEEAEKIYLETIEIDEDFYKVADKLKSHYNLALLSNDVAEWSSFIRKKYNLNQYFDISIVSGEVHLRKPNPEIFSLLLQKLNKQPNDCIYIDDRRTNLEIAHKMGLNTILFNSRNMPYDGKIVNSFSELYQLLLD
ncbi:MAG: HAD family phosphatase [Bacillota bacterium]|nr:HAD family phosphatase [Bacillota bacterium]